MEKKVIKNKEKGKINFASIKKVSFKTNNVGKNLTDIFRDISIKEAKIFFFHLSSSNKNYVLVNLLNDHKNRVTNKTPLAKTLFSTLSPEEQAEIYDKDLQEIFRLYAARNPHEAFETFKLFDFKQQLELIESLVSHNEPSPTQKKGVLMLFEKLAPAKQREIVNNLKYERTEFFKILHRHWDDNEMILFFKSFPAYKQDSILIRDLLCMDTLPLFNKFYVTLDARRKRIISLFIDEHHRDLKMKS